MGNILGFDVRIDFLCIFYDVFSVRDTFLDVLESGGINRSLKKTFSEHGDIHFSVHLVGSNGSESK